MGDTSYKTDEQENLDIFQIPWGRFEEYPPKNEETYPTQTGGSRPKFIDSSWLPNGRAYVIVRVGLCRSCEASTLKPIERDLKSRSREDSMMANIIFPY